MYLFSSSLISVPIYWRYVRSSLPKYCPLPLVKSKLTGLAPLSKILYLPVCNDGSVDMTLIPTFGYYNAP